MGLQYVHAGIIVRDIPDTVVSGQTTLDFDFNTDNTPEFSFMDMGSVGATFDANTVNFVGTGTFNSGHGWDVMRALPYSTMIAANSIFDAQGDAYINPSWANPNEMFPSGDSYIGTTFKIGVYRYYGWILVHLNNGIVTVKSYAYNNTPSGSIFAGQTIDLSTTYFHTPVDLHWVQNPVQSTLSVNLPEQVVSLAIYALNGQCLYRQNGGHSMDVSDWAAGVYLAEIATAQGMMRLRWVKE